MKVQQNAVNVLERTSSYLKAGLLKNTPAWYNVVADVPPSKRFVREPRLVNPANGLRTAHLSDFDEAFNSQSGAYKTRASRADKQGSGNKLYKAPKLKYAEDKLRELFYEQHPWERSRPKMLVENTGVQNYDWSTLHQLGKPLDGESVVQRTLHLLQTKTHSELLAAYEQARFEFYRLRIQEEVQTQVAQEEAEMFGSVFGPSAIDFGLQKEQKIIDIWKQKAIDQSELLSARNSNPAESWSSSQTQSDADSKTPEKQEIQL
ncbi:LANO_0H06458g1_1 [Lachancea nothofagi CBS 11611]|uniref:37S ribosomal protein S25, mitochondrial n=1 Tax=Lachancea nothofagi CBS 11611 TaxID=1266666 RepID=A0A1G4KLD5_9SACH|nr:LANO_0H06458g1_1 [Lachancea nothofagi CBS 11611]